MPVYGDDEGVKELLRATEGATFSPDKLARIADVRKVASLFVEEQTRATFQTPAPAASERVIEVSSAMTSCDRSALYLETGIRTLTSITVGSSWVNGAWSGGTLLTSSEYRLAGAVSTGAFRTIYRTGYWSPIYGSGAWAPYVCRIVATWEDQYPSIPDPINYVTNYIAAEIFKAQKATPAGLIGPEGSMIPIRKAMQIDEVKRILDAYRVGARQWVA